MNRDFHYICYQINFIIMSTKSAFRKDVLFYGMYIIDKILKELGRRHGLSLMQIKYIAGQEMKNFKKIKSSKTFHTLFIL